MVADFLAGDYGRQLPTRRRRGWSGRKVANALARVLDAYGDTCHICGADGADSVDHVLPRSRGGRDNLDNLRPAHLACNMARGDWSDPSTGCHVQVVIGPGAYQRAADRARCDDLVLDLAAIANAVVVDSPRPLTDCQLRVAEAALMAAVGAAGRLDQPAHIWVTDPAPTDDRLRRYAARRWRVIPTDNRQDALPW